MKMMKRVTLYAVGLFALVGCLETRVKAQIAYVPNIGFVPTGATMTVTPAVSADRRYVRLSVNAFFNDLNGFTTVSFPGGAVGGGNFGGFGPGIAAGMNGVIVDEGYPSGAAAGNGVNAQMAAGQTSGMRAGPAPDVEGQVAGDPLLAGDGMGQGQGTEFGVVPGFEDEAALMMDMVNGTRNGIRSAGRSSRADLAAIGNQVEQGGPPRTIEHAAQEPLQQPGDRLPTPRLQGRHFTRRLCAADSKCLTSVTSLPRLL